MHYLVYSGLHDSLSENLVSCKNLCSNLLYMYIYNKICSNLSLSLSLSLSVLVYCMRIFLKIFILVCVLRYSPIYGLCERNPWRNIQEGGIKWVAGFCNETQKARKGIQSEISNNHQVSTTINVWCIDFRDIK